MPLSLYNIVWRVICNTSYMYGLPDYTYVHTMYRSIIICFAFNSFVCRYYILGPKAGKSEFFSENLPGFPDNISPSSTGNYWVGISLVRSSFSDYLSHSGLMMRSILAKVHILFVCVSCICMIILLENSHIGKVSD